MTQLLAVDVGTQSVRAVVFDLAGAMVAREQVALEPPYHATQPGWAELDPVAYWDAMVRAVTALWHHARVRPSDIAGLALTTQRGTIVCSDEAGTPLRPAIVWPDERLATRVPPLGLAWSLAFRVAGARERLRELQAVAEVNWLAQHQPAMARAPRVGMLSSWLLHRLTGEWVDSAASQVGYLPLDYRTQQWAHAWSWRWRALAVTRSQLPRLVAPATRLGPLTAEAARTLGVPPHVPLIAAAADKACEVLGCGAVEPGVAHLSFATAATINTTRARYVEVVRLMPAFPAALPRAFNTEVQGARGFRLVRWFLDAHGSDLRARAASMGVAPESLLEELLASAPVGGVVLPATWQPEDAPPARGGVLYRALVESIIMGLRAGREQIERATGERLTRLVISGGGAQSDEAVRVAANMFALPAERPAVSEASALGAAMLAAVGVGRFSSTRDAVRAMAHTGRTVAPEPTLVAAYDQLYRVAMPQRAR